MNISAEFILHEPHQHSWKRVRIKSASCLAVLCLFMHSRALGLQCPGQYLLVGQHSSAMLITMRTIGLFFLQYRGSKVNINCKIIPQNPKAIINDSPSSKQLGLAICMELFHYQDSTVAKYNNLIRRSIQAWIDMLVIDITETTMATIWESCRQ